MELLEIINVTREPDGALLMQVRFSDYPEEIVTYCAREDDCEERGREMFSLGQQFLESRSN